MSSTVERKPDYEYLPYPEELKKVGKRMLIRTENELAYVVEQIKKSTVPAYIAPLLEREFNGQYKRLLAFDTETEDYGYPKTKAVGLSLSWNGEDGCYIPFGHDEGNQLPWDIVCDALKPWLEDESTLVIMHNATYDIKVIDLMGIKIKANNFADTMILSWLWDTECEHGLKPLTLKWFGYKMTELADLAPKTKHPVWNNKKVYHCNRIPITALGDYASDDAIFTYKLFVLYFPYVFDLYGKVYKDLETEFLFELSEIERFGVYVSEDELKKLDKELHRQIDEAEKALHEKYGDFNPASPKQLNEVLFEKAKIKPMGDKGKNGLYSTKSEYMERWASQGHEVCQMILKIRELKKLQGTYTSSMLKIRNDNGRIYARLNRHGTRTGRLSGSEPNLQNIPHNDEFPIRGAFCAPPVEHSITGKPRKLIVLDYSQIEYRVGAHLTKDPEMIRVYKNDIDLHSRTAKACWRLDCAPEDVPELYPKYRKMAKSVNFGIFYEMGAQALADNINGGLKPGEKRLTKAEAQRIIDNFHEDYKYISAWIDFQHSFAERHGYVKTLTGRRRNLSLASLDPRNFKDTVRKADGTTVEVPWYKLSQQRKKDLMGLKSKAFRQSSNTPVQGSASDIMAIAMRNIRRWAIEKGWWGRELMLVLQVHDEIMIECDEDLSQEIYDNVKEIMETAVKLRVPVKAEGHIADTWLEAK